MCFSYLHLIEDGSAGFILVDRRVSVADYRGVVDTGAKLVHTALGWVGGAGRSGDAFHVALSAMRSAPAVPTHDPARRVANVVTAALASAGMDTSDPGRDFGTPSPVTGHVLEAFGREIVAVQFRNGTAQEMWDDTVMPADLASDRALELNLRVVRETRAASPDLASRIRLAARWFAKIAAESRVVSPDVEIGYLQRTPQGFARGFLRGTAEAIGAAEAGDILETFAAVPGRQLPNEILAELAVSLDGNPGIGSTRQVARSAGTGHGSTAEDRTRAGDGGIPTPQGIISTQHVYDATGATALIDTGTGRFVAGLDAVDDGSTYKRVAGINGSNLVTQTSVSSKNRCLLHISASASVASGSNTSINFDVEDFDSNNLHEGVTHPERITVPTGGGGCGWLVTAMLRFDSNATGYREVTIVRGISTIATLAVPAMGGGEPTYVQATVIDVPSDGDYYWIEAFQNSGGSLNVAEAHLGAIALW